MIFVVYSSTNRRTIESRLGEADYSYHFVLERFRPVLEQMGTVVEISIQPEIRVDAIFDIAQALGEDCLFLSFTPPHKTLLHLRCPTVCLFAWEFYDLPRSIDQDVRQDWAFALKALGSSITHSRLTVDVVQKSLEDDDYLIAAIPAPVFDSFARDETEPVPSPRLCSLVLNVLGHVFEAPRIPDTAPGGARTMQRIFHRSEPKPPPGARRPPPKNYHLELDGIVYTATFNPEDGRKNWREIVRCFGLALADRSDAVLILKVIHNGPPWGVRHRFRRTLDQLGPLKCRILLLDGYLDAASYRKLVRSTTYVVNASLGEGQCLPLMESMSAGRPAIAPPHTGMADYVDASNAFLVQSSLEPTAFPDDPAAKLRTWRHRIDAHSLFEAFEKSYRVATEEPERYAEMSRSAAATLREHCSVESCRVALEQFFDRRSQIAPDLLTRSRARDSRKEIEKAVMTQRLRFEWTKRRKNQTQPIHLPPGPVADLPLRFIVAGFGKCGTTTFSALLDSHPNLFIPEVESWFFSSGSMAQEDEFRRFFSLATESQQLGLCGVSYSSVHDEAFARSRILFHYPEVRILFIARDPLARVESVYREFHDSWHHTAIPKPPFDVGETLRKIPEIARNCRYGARIAHYAECVPADRIHVLFFEDLLRDPGEVLRSCYEFLGVDPHVPTPGAIPRLNSRIEKLRDTPKFREMLDPSVDSTIAHAFKVLDLEERDQIAVPCGLRRPHEEELPGWDEGVQRRFVAEIEEDLRKFLREHGKTEDVWPRFAALCSSQSTERSEG